MEMPLEQSLNATCLLNDNDLGHMPVPAVPLSNYLPPSLVIGSRFTGHGGSTIEPRAATLRLFLQSSKSDILVPSDAAQ